MGKAVRWLKGLFSGGKKKTGGFDEEPSPKPMEEGRRKWGFARSFRDRERKEGSGGGGLVERKGKGKDYGEVSRSYGLGSGGGVSPLGVGDEEEQNKRAIAVAAATAAVAEAAVAAAQAAAAVVRLTSSGRTCGADAGRRCQEWAAVRIQAAFRGYLARRALKALKALVKLQALVRGHIVRKQTAETLRCMHALVRAQVRARVGRRSSGYEDPCQGRSIRQNCKHSNGVSDSKSETLKTHRRNSSRAKNAGSIDANALHPSGLNWLDHWMEERYRDSQETLSTAGTKAVDDEKNDKILEIDTGKPHLNSKRRNRHYSMSSTPASDQLTRSLTTMPDTPSKDSTIAQRSVPSPSSVDMQQSLSPLRFPLEAGEPCDSPQFFSAASRPGSARGGPFTPSKSECSRSFFGGYSAYPNYMAYTESSRAKARSQSAPRQRPEFEKSCSIKRLSLVHGSISRCQSSTSSQVSSSLHYKFTGKAYPGSGRLDRLGMPIRI